MPGAWEGVVVTKIRRGSPAHRLRFRPGDIVLGVNKAAVRTVRDLVSELNRAADRWRISFLRDGRVHNVEIGA